MSAQLRRCRSRSRGAPSFAAGERASSTGAASGDAGRHADPVVADPPAVAERDPVTLDVGTPGPRRRDADDQLLRRIGSELEGRTLGGLGAGAVAVDIDVARAVRESA